MIRQEKLIWILLTMIGIVGILIPVAYGEHIPDRWKITECNLISVEPYYDCSETLVIFWFDTLEYPPWLNVTSGEWILQNDDDEYLGFAYYDIITTEGIFNLVIIGNSTDSSWYPEDNNGTSLLGHELKHIACKCNFHEETDKEQERTRNENNNNT